MFLSYYAQTKNTSETNYLLNFYLARVPYNMETAGPVSKKIVPLEGLTFDDLLLVPNFTDFKRHQVDLTTILHPHIRLKLPIMAAPMDTVCEMAMATALSQQGGLGIIHRNLPVTRQVNMVAEVKKTRVVNLKKAAVDRSQRLLVGAAVGVGPDCTQRIQALRQVEADVIVVDSAHGYAQDVIEIVVNLKKNYPDWPVMAGNIATYEAGRALIKAGADILRVGMGPGSICTTRIVTGVGVPQITAIQEAVRACVGTAAVVVADGGLRQIGDMAKALALGAGAVMLGSLLAPFDESPGKIVSFQGKKYKQYQGMGSVAAMKKGGAERYGQSSRASNKTLIPEGVEGLVEYRGAVADYLQQVEGSLRSAFYYVGGRTLSQFNSKARFIRATPAAVVENHPHSITLTNAGDNYVL